MGERCCFPEYCVGLEAGYSRCMVIARFNRSLAVLFFVLMTVAVVACVGGFSWLMWNKFDLYLFLLGAGGAVVGLLSIIGSGMNAVSIFHDSRAIWIENGALHFYDDLFVGLVPLSSKVEMPLDSIAGISSSKTQFPDAIERHGIYVELKAGKTHKVLMSSLLCEREKDVIARLRVALHLPQADT